LPYLKLFAYGLLKEMKSTESGMESCKERDNALIASIERLETAMSFLHDPIVNEAAKQSEANAIESQLRHEENVAQAIEAMPEMTKDYSCV
jgi:hypothetical protein